MNYDYSNKIVELLENAEKKNKEVIDLLSKNLLIVLKKIILFTLLVQDILI